MNKLTDEQIRKHRADTKARAEAENKLDKNWKNKLFDEVDEDGRDADSEASEA